jgi:hypothetical protein
LSLFYPCFADKLQSLGMLRLRIGMAKDDAIQNLIVRPGTLLLAFAKLLQTPKLYDLVKDKNAERLTDITNVSVPAT